MEAQHFVYIPIICLSESYFCSSVKLRVHTQSINLYSTTATIMTFKAEKVFTETNRYNINQALSG